MLLRSFRLSVVAAGCLGIILFKSPNSIAAPQAATQSATTAATDEKAKAAETTKADPRVGKSVIVTVDRAPLRTPKEIVWKAYRGEVFQVSLVNGEWLWVASKQGWLWENETVPFDTAIDVLTKAIEESATAENYDMRGIAYTAHEKYEEAVADFSESLKKKANTPGVLNNRGRAHYLSDNYKLAKADFDSAITNSPRHFVAMLNRALCFMAEDNLDSAMKDLNAAIALNKEFPEALNNRGVVHSRRKDYPKAVADFSAAIKIDAAYIDAYGNRAAAYREMKKYPEAESDLKIAMQKAPLDYKPVNDLAWFFATVSEASRRKPEDAVKLATKACEMTQYEDWNTLDTLAAAYGAKGDFKEAQQWITTALEKAPEEEKARLKSHQALLLAEKEIVK